jgi:RimJ/RimL family protein N-acetyltransferase
MSRYPEIYTNRLHLRGFQPEEGMVVRSLAGDQRIAQACLNIPHPYGVGMAETWISCHQEWYEEGIQIVFAITRKEDGWIIGAIGMEIETEHNRGEMGYWIGIPFWGHGYATEAVKAMLTYAFDSLHLNRVTASYFKRNPASGRVLEKCGLQYEGLLQKHIMKDGKYEDIIVCGIVHTQWDIQPKVNPGRNL